MSEDTGHRLGFFAAGALLAALVAWAAWPIPYEPTPELERQAPRIRQHEPLQLSSTESMRAVIIPGAERLSSYLCVVYTNTQSGQALLACPNESFIDLGQYEE